MTTEQTTQQAQDGEIQVQVRFKTRQKEYAVTDTAILLPATFRRYHLSETINHLLGRNDEDEGSQKPIPFNFLIDGKFLQTSLKKYLDSHGLSTENIVELEYVEATLPPTESAAWQHDEWISSVKGNRDTNVPFVLTGSYDNFARVWDRSGNCRAVVKGHTAAVKSVAWLPSSSEQMMGTEPLRFLTGGQDVKIFGWEYSGDQADATTRIAYECVGHTASVDDIAVHSSGSHFASVSWDGTILIWSTNPTDVEKDDHPESRKRRKVQDDSTSTASGSIPLKRAEKRLTGHVGAVSSAVYERTNSSTASLYTGGWDHSVRIWDIESSSNTSTMNCEKVILDMDHSALSGLIVSGHSDNLIRLWDPRVQEGLVVKLKLASHTNWVSSVSWSPSSAYSLVSGSYDSTLKVWDIRSSTPLYTLSGGDKEKDQKVFAIDWVGDYIFSGGEDAQLRSFNCKMADHL